MQVGNGDKEETGKEKKIDKVVMGRTVRRQAGNRPTEMGSE